MSPLIEPDGSLSGVDAGREELAAPGLPGCWLGSTSLAGAEALSLRLEGTEHGVRATQELADVPFDRLLHSVEVECDD